MVIGGMKLTLHKYIFREIWPTSVACLLVFALVMMATRMLSVTEWVINQGVYPLQVLNLVAFLLPNLILFALPAVSLIAVLVAFLRLSSDNEIIALKSTGISLYQMLPPVLVFSFIGCLGATLIAVFGVPWGNRSFKDMVFQILESKADIGIKERVFFQPCDDVFLYINKISTKDRVMKDIFVEDRRDKSIRNTIVAKEGRILSHRNSRMITFRFKDGTIFILEKGFRTTRTIEFETYDLNIGLDDLMPSLALRKKAPKELFIRELIHNINRTPKGGVKYNEMVIELLERLSIPLAVFLMGLIAVPLGSQLRSRIRSLGIFLGLVIFLIYYMCFMGMKSLCETGALSPYIGMWIPDMFLVVCCVYLLQRVANERPLNIFKK
ncbi:MAG: LPS export ABC transporter permease LptF [Deltaproteobacteria bacterium]|nr:LPS export ABC transporter permease LptF [Deltaproteobacteria bacterium]